MEGYLACTGNTDLECWRGRCGRISMALLEVFQQRQKLTHA